MAYGQQCTSTHWWWWRWWWWIRVGEVFKISREMLYYATFFLEYKVNTKHTYIWRTNHQNLQFAGLHDENKHKFCPNICPLAEQLSIETTKLDHFTQRDFATDSEWQLFVYSYISLETATEYVSCMRAFCIDFFLARVGWEPPPCLFSWTNDRDNSLSWTHWCIMRIIYEKVWMFVCCYSTTP